MPQPSLKEKDSFFFKGLPLVLTISGGLFFLYTILLYQRGIFQILPGVFSESINVPLDYVQLGLEIFPIQVENFILLQSFESLPPLSYPKFSLFWGTLFWISAVMISALLSTFKRTPFIIAMGVWMALLSISGINSLNIGGIYSNYSLLILLAGWVTPLVFINFYKSDWSLFRRFAFILPIASLTLIGLIYASEMPSAALLVAENFTLPAVALSAFFLLHIGHAIVSGSSILLIKLNKGIQLKISYHLLVIFSIYFLLVLFTLLDVLGEVNLPFPVLPPFLLFLIAGVIGYFVYQEKINQTDQPYESPLIGQALYLSLFGLTLWTWAKVIYVENQPYIDFFNHIFLYGQVALSLLFSLYIFANFSGIINSGKDVEKILFKPQHFAYFHMRIGSMMALAILIVFGNTIIANHLASGSTNQAADYYYQAELPKQAAILYESAWMQYRKNDKAKNAAVHLRLLEGDKRDAMEQLEQSMDFNPSVPNILLISKLLHEQDKIFEAVFYLENGLKLFPSNPYLLNNLALLQSKLNKPSEALENLALHKENDPVFKSNWLALHVKHQRETANADFSTVDPITQINQLAYANRLGNVWKGELSLADASSNFIVQTAAIRNLWTNQPKTELQEDLALIDSLIATTEVTFRERNLRDSKAIRLYQERQIGEVLKFLNGSAGIFSSSAGYYHQWSALILAGQLDFEKAAVDILVAEERGVSDFKPYHLAVLYFGDKPIDALRFSQKFDLSFPSWMNWGDDGKLEPNAQIQYFEGLRGFHTKLENELLEDLAGIDQGFLSAAYATHLLLYKAHLLNENHLQQLSLILESEEVFPITRDEIANWVAYVNGKSNSIPENNTIAQLLQPELGLSRNPYWTPMVLKSLDTKNDDLERYNTLQDAKLFNKDPLLWIAYIKQASKAGLGMYANDAIDEMSKWLDRNEISRLLEDQAP